MADSVFIGWLGPIRFEATGSTVIFPGNLQAERFLGADGTAAAPTFSFYGSGDGDNGMYLSAADTLGWSAGGTLRLSLSSSALTSTLPFNVPNGANPEYVSMYWAGNAFNIETVVNGGTARNLTFGRGSTTYQTLNSSGVQFGVGVGVGVTPGAAGNVNAQTYSVSGVAGASFSGAVTNITVVNGIVTAAS